MRAKQTCGLILVCLCQDPQGRRDDSSAEYGKPDAWWESLPKKEGLNFSKLLKYQCFSLSWQNKTLYQGNWDYLLDCPLIHQDGKPAQVKVFMAVKEIESFTIVQKAPGEIPGLSAAKAANIHLIITGHCKEDLNKSGSVCAKGNMETHRCG